MTKPPQSEPKKSRHSVRADGVVTLTVGIEANLKESLRALAGANERGFSDYVRKILRDHVRKELGGDHVDTLAEKLAEAKRLLATDKATLRLKR